MRFQEDDSSISLLRSPPPLFEDGHLKALWHVSIGDRGEWATYTLFTPVLRTPICGLYVTDNGLALDERPWLTAIFRDDAPPVDEECSAIRSRLDLGRFARIVQRTMNRWQPDRGLFSMRFCAA